MGERLEIPLDKKGTTLRLTKDVIGFDPEFAKELLNKNPHSLFAGLSLSKALPPLIIGDLPPESVPFLLTGTAHETVEKALANIISILNDKQVLNGKQEKAEKILKEYWDNGRIIQLRKLIPDLPGQLAASGAPFIRLKDFNKYLEQKYEKIYREIIKSRAQIVLYDAMCTSPTTLPPQPLPQELQNIINIVDPGVSK